MQRIYLEDSRRGKVAQPFALVKDEQVFSGFYMQQPEFRDLSKNLFKKE